MDPCTEERRFENLENDVKELKEAVKQHSQDISNLMVSHSETVVYVKEIKADIKEIKDDIKKISQEDIKQQESNKSVNPVMIELIKLLGTAITIIGAIAGFKAIGG